MILDRATEVVRAYRTVLVDDGHGNRIPMPTSEYVEFRAFIVPAGFSGAGWAVDERLRAQGYADVDRVRVICKPTPETGIVERWTRMEFRNALWTVQEMPRLYRGLRPGMEYLAITVEILGREA